METWPDQIPSISHISINYYYLPDNPAIPLMVCIQLPEYVTPRQNTSNKTTHKGKTISNIIENEVHIMFSPDLKRRTVCPLYTIHNTKFRRCDMNWWRSTWCYNKNWQNLFHNKSHLIEILEPVEINPFSTYWNANMKAV